MKSGVPLRVFDVPACGAFILTDHTEDMDILFDGLQESICYDSREDLLQKVSYFLSHPGERRKISQKIRQRVLACHTYQHRAETMVRAMRKRYG
jgi:spore maturation protein CgeB